MKASKAARHAEVARRYAWQARQRRKGDSGTEPSRLITLIRLRELERIFQSRYGRFLPDDDAGRDDLALAANHIVFLRGEVVEHIVGWARAWAPWMPHDEAAALAERIAPAPEKFTADELAWRLRLSMSERTDLKITTIGSFDVAKAERLELRKAKRREAERKRRAAHRTGKPRGRPTKNAWPAGSTLLLATVFPKTPRQGIAALLSYLQAGVTISCVGKAAQPVARPVRAALWRRWPVRRSQPPQQPAAGGP